MDYNVPALCEVADFVVCVLSPETELPSELKRSNIVSFRQFYIASFVCRNYNVSIPSLNVLYFKSVSNSLLIRVVSP